MDLDRLVLAYLYAKGSSTLDDIAKGLGVDKAELARTLSSLESSYLVRAQKKGLVFKKLVYSLTPKGLEEGSKAYTELNERAQKVNELAQSGSDLSSLGLIPAEVMLMNLLGLLSVETIAALSLIGLMQATEAVEEVAEQTPEEESETDALDYDGDFDLDDQ